MLRKILSYVIPSQIISSSNETLPELIQRCQVSIIKGDEQQSSETLLKIISYCFQDHDFTFLGFNLCTILASQNHYVRSVGFLICSIVLTESSPSIQLMPSVLRRSFQFEELLVPSLSALLYIINPELFSYLKKDLLGIASTGGNLPRRYALLIIYRAYRHKTKILKHLLPLLKKAIFHDSVRFIATSITCEIHSDYNIYSHSPKNYQNELAIFNSHREEFLQFTEILISQIPLAPSDVFSKISRFFMTFDPKDLEAHQENLEKAIFQYLNKNVSFYSIIDAAILAQKFSHKTNSSFYNKLGILLQTELMGETPYSNQFMVLKSLIGIYPIFCPDKATIISLLHSVDPQVAAEAQKLRFMMIDQENRSKALEEIFQFIEQYSNSELAEFAVSVFPSIYPLDSNSEEEKKAKKNGKAYIDLIFTIEGLDLPGTDQFLTKALKTACEDPLLRSFAIKQVNELMNELPDSNFGRELAAQIASGSNDPNDLQFLIPCSISLKTPDLQSLLLGCAQEMWMRLGCTIPKGLDNRIVLLTQSSNHEVRQRASEFVVLINLKQSF